jgi:hypothetical protein
MMIGQRLSPEEYSMSDRFTDLIGQVDVAFVVDTTGSMGPFIDAARAQIRSIADDVGRAGDLDLRFAVVEYRDHPPGDVVRRPPILSTTAMGPAGWTPTPSGGDAPEAVLDFGSPPTSMAGGGGPACSLATRRRTATATRAIWPEGCPAARRRTA